MRNVLIASAVLLAISGKVAAQMGNPSSVSPAEDAKILTKAEREYDSAKKLFHLHPSPRSKQGYVVATDRYALTSMTAGTLPPKVKYRQALRLYREALKIDPKNDEAVKNSNLIISIYQSMHRPVPK